MELLAAGVGVSEIASRFGVSRQAIYDWQKRNRDDGAKGLEDRSRRPHTSPRRTPEAIEQRLIAERRQWGFGSKKILRRLQDAEPEVAWPPRSTIDAIFQRAGLVSQRRVVQRRFFPSEARRTYEAGTAGEVMTADYKGQFRLRNGRYCYPLLIADPVSRYLLACDAFTRIALEQTWDSMVRVFREHGLPNILHTDNGMPFGTSGHGRFSTISVRLMKYGIQPVYNRPGHPEDNGRHERLNRTLMESATIPPAEDHARQQEVFDCFRRVYNHERPHESLQQDRPVMRHRHSPRSFPEHEPIIKYPAHFETHRVNPRGRMYWRGERIYFSDAFANE
jgi:transposase InsO family protein